MFCVLRSRWLDSCDSSVNNLESICLQVKYYLSRDKTLANQRSVISFHRSNKLCSVLDIISHLLMKSIQWIPVFEELFWCDSILGSVFKTKHVHLLFVCHSIGTSFVDSQWRFDLKSFIINSILNTTAGIRLSKRPPNLKIIFC